MKRELVKNAINHTGGGTPYCVALTGDGYAAYGEKLFRDYPNAKAEEDYRAGRLNLSQAVSLAIGNHVLYVSPPWWDWHGLPREFGGEDAPAVMPDTIGRGSYEAFFSQCAYIRENYDVYILAVIFGSHWEKAYFCRGIENFLRDLAGDPDWARRLLELIIRKNIVMIENFVHTACCDGALLGSDWGTQRGLIMSPDCWRGMIKEGERLEYELIHKHGKDVWIHSCGKIDDIMDELCGMGMDVLNPVQPECMELSELKAKYGGRTSFYGGISTQRVLPYGAPRDVAKETEETIALMGAGGGYITSPSQEIQTDVPYENLRALIDTAKRFSE